jgi:lipid II:glycine glycyltransferase (peptidoglycan interpeptide bridge formation enzyme)
METFDTGARIAVLENEIKNIAEDVKEIRKENKEQHAVLMSKFESFESRIAIIERWRWMVVGGALALGYLINHFYKFF